MFSKSGKGNIAKAIVNQSGVREAKKTSDTVRVWENYREQALLWRAIALLQIPATFIAIVFAMIMWKFAPITINVPQNPLPGYYSARQVPEAQFVSEATEFINLITNYQPSVAKRQFKRAAEHLIEPFLAKFSDEMLGRELAAIESTSRTQFFWIVPDKTKVLWPTVDSVQVILVGERIKIVAGEQLPTKMTMYKVTMKTIPRNTFNPYGIVITDVEQISGDRNVQNEETKVKALLKQQALQRKR